jgi:DNA invertase Pin-like site-specific DNA recombinase
MNNRPLLKKGGRMAIRRDQAEDWRGVVEVLASHGVRHADIARVLGVSRRTLGRYFPAELARGHIRANVRVAENLLEIATGDAPESVTAAIFWLKCRAGWRPCA